MIHFQTYKKTPDAQTLSFDLHFWLGENTSQDEAGTAGTISDVFPLNNPGSLL